MSMFAIRVICKHLPVRGTVLKSFNVGHLFKASQPSMRRVLYLLEVAQDHTARGSRLVTQWIEASREGRAGIGRSTHLTSAFTGEEAERGHTFPKVP